jgi:tRNA-guanine family transglycosylase
MKFKLEKKDPQSKARAGTIFTDHGEIKTPIFMPVGTMLELLKGFISARTKRRHKSTNYTRKHLPLIFTTRN